MDASKKEDKQNFKIGLYVTIVTGIVLLLFVLFWENEEREQLSCLGVQSQINSLIDTAKKYKSNGAPLQNIEKLNKDIEHQLNENKKLNCGFPEKSIRTYFKF